jgi:hypothetical protein
VLAALPSLGRRRSGGDPAIPTVLV